jgi:hypothetical protein
MLFLLPEKENVYSLFSIHFVNSHRKFRSSRTYNPNVFSDVLKKGENKLGPNVFVDILGRHEYVQGLF